MKTSDNELICAYLDGELNDIERAKFERRLAEETPLAKQFAEFEQNDLALQQHYSAIDDTPVPDSIMRLLADTDETTEPVTEKTDSSSNVVQLDSWRPSKWIALAACFLMVALTVPVYMQFNQEQSQLASILNQSGSGQTIALSDQEQIYLSMSFTDQQGNFCREYMLSQTSSTAHNVACQINGDWQIQVSGEINRLNNQAYQPASGQLAPKVEAWLDQNMLSDPFSQTEEQKRLNKK